MTKREVVKAFKEDRVGRCANAETKPNSLTLYGWVIAELDKHNELWIATNGINSRTTLSWVNLVLDEFRITAHVSNVKGHLSLGGFPWDGNPVNVESWLYQQRRKHDNTETVATGIS